MKGEKLRVTSYELAGGGFIIFSKGWRPVLLSCAPTVLWGLLTVG